jgi:carbonic anhydrase
MTDDDNPVLDPIINKLKDLKSFGASETINNLSISSLIAPLEHYYYYDGSLTTPTCDEFVKWVIVEKAIQISEDQLLPFQELHDELDIEVNILTLTFILLYFF